MVIYWYIYCCFSGFDIILDPPVLFRCDFEDTAQYRASAMNVKGELSAYASLVVKSRFARNISIGFSLYCM